MADRSDTEIGSPDTNATTGDRDERSRTEREGRYCEIFESIDEGFCIVEVLFDEADRPVDYLFVDVNPAFERQTGIQNAVGRRMREIAPDHEEHWFEIYGAVALTGEPIRFERPAEQLRRCYDVYAFRIGDPARREVAILFHDITDRKLTEAALAESEHRFRLLVEQTSEYAIFSTDPERRILIWNAGAERFLGFTAEEIVGTTADVIFTPEDRAADAPGHEVRKALEEGRAANRRWHVKKDGSRFWGSGFVEPIYDERGTLTGFLKIMRDETREMLADRERTELLERERAARAEAEMANRLKDEFLATLSHELRTPLNAISGWASLLADGMLDEPAARRAVETIRRNAALQQKLIDDVLDVSRIITGKVRLEIEAVDVPSAVLSAIESVRPAADAKRIRLETSLGAGSTPVRADPERLQQILWNLVSNAVKFTPAGGTVRIETRAAGEAADISVSDTGEGIDKAFLPHVFDRFRQADGTTTRSHSGLGLGLAIVRHLVEMHGGAVRAESEGAGRGANFVVRLPRFRADRESDECSAPVSEALAGVATYDTRLDGLRVLVVDDEADARDLSAVVVASAGADVRTAASAAEAVQVLETWRPDVLVVDIGMPVEDGYTFVRTLRTRSEGGGGYVPALALSAYTRPEDARRALEAGFQLHVAKPFAPEDLVAAIRMLHDDA